VEGFYIAGGVLVAWAVILTVIGVRREDFPSTPNATRIVGAISIVLVVTAIGLAIYLSATEEEHESGGGEEAAALVAGLS
jgi:multisubunit Na+/H+ antiporter MnhB subunit